MIRKLWKRAVTRQTAQPFFAFGERGISGGIESSVEAAVSLYERLVSELPVGVWRDGQPDPGHRLNGLLLDPSPVMNRAQFFARACRNVLLEGNAYISIVGENNFLKLHWRSEDVSAGENQSEIITFYQTRDGFIPAEDMIHIREIKGSEIARGRSKLETLKTALENIQGKQGFLSQWSFQSKGFIKGMAGITPTKAKSFQKDLENFIKDDKFSLLTIAEKADLKAFTPESKIQDFVMFQAAIRKAVFQIFGIPLFLISAEKSNSYKAATEALTVFVRTSLSGLLSLIESEFSFKLLNRNERRNNYAIQFDLSKLLRSDRETESKNIMVLRQSGTISPNDGRRMIGLAPVSGADYLTPTEADGGQK